MRIRKHPGFFYRGVFFIPSAVSAFFFTILPFKILNLFGNQWNKLLFAAHNVF